MGDSSVTYQVLQAIYPSPFLEKPIVAARPPISPVEAMERCGNRRPRVQKLFSAWNQGSCGDIDVSDQADDALIGASAEPKKRPRTRLTDEEVDAMRTARANGVSVNELARQFGIHREIGRAHV